VSVQFGNLEGEITVPRAKVRAFRVAGTRFSTGLYPIFGKFLGAELSSALRRGVMPVGLWGRWARR
jgi:hypothetical protein